jgi:hypothetical protein
MGWIDKKRVVVPLLGAAVLLLLLFVRVRIDVHGDWEGLYLLKGDNSGTYILTDDIFFGETHPVLFRMTLPFRSNASRGGHYGIAAANGSSTPSEPEALPNTLLSPEGTLSWQWHERTGRGFVVNSFANGSRLLTCFGRYRDGDGAAPAGLLVGGSIPNAADRNGRINLNASGMAYYQNRHWYHIWCSVNEAIVLNDSSRMVIAPSRWRFLGSRVCKGGPGELVLSSRHEIPAGRTTLLMERFVRFRGGERHFVLVTRITNNGTAAADYSYVYGDEPWLGKYGTSAGDVGWLTDRLVTSEGGVDLNKYQFAGMVDYGNDLIREGHTFTGAANFIQWLGDERPDALFFSNRPGDLGSDKQPLSGDARFIGLEFGPRLLPPKGTNTFVLAVGMADKDPRNGFPVKPAVNFTLRDLAGIL